MLCGESRVLHLTTQKLLRDRIMMTAQEIRRRKIHLKIQAIRLLLEEGKFKEIESEIEKIEKLL